MQQIPLLLSGESCEGKILMERALFISNPAQLNKLNNFSRIYFGTEFCQNNIPSLGILKEMYSFTHKHNKEFTFVSPYVTTLGLKKIEPLLKYLNERNNTTEVVFNDWGVFKFIKENYKNIKPVVGRLLTKQQRDPRACDTLLKKVRITTKFEEKSRKLSIFIPKRIPFSLLEYFKGGLFNTPVFQQFLLSNGIKRMEIDNLIWDMKIKVDRKIGISIYLPYNYISTTRLCGLLNLTYSVCNKECHKYYLSLINNSTSVPFYIRGNTIFYKSIIPSAPYLKKRRIDRIVWESEVPV